MLGVVRHADVTLATGAVGAFTHPASGGDRRRPWVQRQRPDHRVPGRLQLRRRHPRVRRRGLGRQPHAAVCPAINAYRQSLVDGTPIPPPAPNRDCPDSPAPGGFFGNTDIFGGSYADPTTPITSHATVRGCLKAPPHNANHQIRRLVLSVHAVRLSAVLALPMCCGDELAELYLVLVGQRAGPSNRYSQWLTDA